MSKKFCVTVLVSLLTILVPDVKGDKRLRFTITSVDTWSDNNYANFTYAIDESVPSFDFSFKTLKQLPDMDVHIEIMITQKLNNKYYAIMNTTHSVCQVLAFKNASPVTALLFAHLNTNGNIPDSCPIKVDNYYMKKLWPEDHLAKMKIPELNFEAHFQVFVVEGGADIKIVDNVFKGEAIYKEVSGEGKKGLLSMLGGK